MVPSTTYTCTPISMKCKTHYIQQGTNELPLFTQIAPSPGFAQIIPSPGVTQMAASTGMTQITQVNSGYGQSTFVPKTVIHGQQMGVTLPQQQNVSVYPSKYI